MGLLDFIGIGDMFNMGAGIYDRYQQEKWNKKSFEEQQRQFNENMAWQKYQSQNRYQDMIGDLKKAGLNPIMASGAQAYSPSPVSTSASLQKVGGSNVASMNTLAMNAVDQDNKLKESQGRLYEAEAYKTQAEADALRDKDTGLKAQNAARINLDKANAQQIGNYIQNESPANVALTLQQKLESQAREADYRASIDKTKAETTTINEHRSKIGKNIDSQTEANQARAALDRQRKITEWLNQNKYELETQAMAAGIERQQLENALLLWNYECTRSYGQRSDVQPSDYQMERNLERLIREGRFGRFDGTVESFRRTMQTLWDNITKGLSGFRFNIKTK